MPDKNDILIYRLRSSRSDDHLLISEAADRIELREEQIEILRAALIRAREDMEGWAEYASEYFRGKWDVSGDLAAIDLAAIDSALMYDAS